MLQLCSKCSRANPPEAIFCYFDGLLLEGRERTTGTVGAQLFASPFVFPSGRACRSFDELALGCLAEWSVAVGLLDEGYFESFLGFLGRADLALRAKEAARFPDLERGLDKLLSQLPTNLLDEAKLRVEPLDVNLGLLEGEAPRRFDVELENQGLRLLYGGISSSDNWLTLGEACGVEKRFHFLHDHTVSVQVWPARVRASQEPIVANLVVETNGGTVTIGVKAEKKVKPFPPGPLGGLLKPRQVAESAQRNPKEVASLFESGEVERWYQANGWIYPVKVPAASGVAAIQQFFEALGMSKAPMVDLNTRQIHLKGEPGERLGATLEVSSLEKRPVFAHATSNAPWLQVHGSHLDGKTVVLDLVIPAVPHQPGTTLSAELDVLSNGNTRWRVPVTLEVTLTRRSEAVKKPPSGPTRRVVRSAPIWLHLLPMFLLLSAVFAVVAYDLYLPKTIEPPTQKIAGPNYDPRQLRDPKPRIGVTFNPEDRFGVVMLDAHDPADPGRWKRLTFTPNGSTNNTVVKIGTSEYLFGYLTPANKLTRSQSPLPSPYLGWTSTMDFSEEKVRVTQYLQFVPGHDNLLDTLLIYYRAYNYGTVPQKVAVRVMLDTYIGKNDGVPFTAPGEKGFVTTKAEYKRPGIPDYLEVVENPEDSKDPGTIARIGLRGLAWGEVELREPELVRICRFPGPQMKWDWDMENMRDDSCVAVYWPQEELSPKGTMHQAMTYGLGKLDISDHLALSTRRNVQVDEEFIVTAYVYNATIGQKITLELPQGMQFVQDEAEQTIMEAAKRTQVFWKVRAIKEGDRQIEAISGRARARPVIVQVRTRSIFG